MHTFLVATLVLHVLSGVFWAGSTFAAVRAGGLAAKGLLRPQMGAAAVVVLTGGLLWHLLHPGSPGKTEYILAAGALAAVAAAAVQGLAGAWTARQLSHAEPSQAARLEARMAIGQRIAAALLAITVICMAAARYA